MIKSIEPVLLSSTEASKFLGIGRSLFYNLMNEEKLPTPKRLGSRVLWSKQELVDWIAADCPSRYKWDEIKNNI